MEAIKRIENGLRGESVIQGTVLPEGAKPVN
jgi:hypothetical protein